jgi:hypothetical protein
VLCISELASKAMDLALPVQRLADCYLIQRTVRESICSITGLLHRRLPSSAQLGDLGPMD